MHEHARAVDALPVEGAVGKVVDPVPGELDGLEPIHSALAQDLWQISVVAEGVRKPAQPQLVVGEREFLPKESPADECLSYERFTRGQVGVRLHPE